MLILSLRVNESITIAGGIEIMLTEIGVRGLQLRGGHVKLGIRAPKHVRVHRGRKVAVVQPKPRRRL